MLVGSFHASGMICNHNRNKNQETELVAEDYRDYYLKLE